MTIEAKVIYRDAADHLEWKRAQAALLAEKNKRIDLLEHAVKLAKQEIAMGHPHWAAETLRRALFPPKEGS